MWSDCIMVRPEVSFVSRLYQRFVCISLQHMDCRYRVIMCGQEGYVRLEDSSLIPLPEESDDRCNVCNEYVRLVPVRCADHHVRLYIRNGIERAKRRSANN